jgi:muramoyltetrapeptide carboxypeptidase
VVAEAARRPSIGFFAPSGFLPDPAVMDRAAANLSSSGWRVCAGETVFARELRFAGDDEARLAELLRFATDSSLDVAIAARGGYGLTRLLDRIDFDAIAARAPILCGYSDFTAFNLAYLAKAKGVSFQGPAATDFCADSPNDAGNAARFLGAISAPEYEFAFSTPAAPMEAKGTLWGGNLSMVCSLLGTPYLPRVRAGLLFLEDVNESAYRIERMLLQLLQAGVLGAQKAVLLGSITGVAALPGDNGFTLDHALAHVADRSGVPFVRGLPFGHGAQRWPLAVGAKACLRVVAGTATLSVRGYPHLCAGAGGRR